MNGPLGSGSGAAGQGGGMTQIQSARFGLGQIVRHRDDAFRGVVMDVDARYAGDPAAPGPDRPAQPFYRIYVIGEGDGLIAYAAEDVLERDPEIGALSPADEARWFTVDGRGRHAPLSQPIH